MDDAVRQCIAEVTGVLRDGDRDRSALQKATREMVSAVDDLQGEGTEETYRYWKQSLDDFHSDLKETLSTSLDVLKRYSHIRERDQFQGLQSSVESLREIMTMSHRLAYSAFAPPGYEIGDQLGVFKPPVPQPSQFLTSRLHEYATRYEEIQDMTSDVSVSDSDVTSGEPGKKRKMDGTLNAASFKDSTEVTSPVPSEEKKSEKETEKMSEGVVEITEEATVIEETAIETPSQLDVPQPAFSSFVLNPDLEEEEESSGPSEASDSA